MDEIPCLIRAYLITEGYCTFGQATLMFPVEIPHLATATCPMAEKATGERLLRLSPAQYL
jgi:hypothetical protein